MSDLLFLTQRIPYPPDKGEKVRSWQILRHLAKSHRVHLGCLLDDPADLPHVDTLKALCADACIEPIDRRLSKILCLRGLLTGDPLSVSYFRNSRLQRWVDRVLRQVKPEVVFVSSGNMMPYLHGRSTGTARRVVDLVDVDSEKWREYAETASFPMRHVYSREARLIFALEHGSARTSDATTLVSPPEAALFKRLAPDCAGQTHAISNGVDLDYFKPDAALAPPPAEPGRADFVFTGTMNYPPNEDAARWFAEDIFPLIRKAMPEARFLVVGSNPSPMVQKLAELPGVTVTGRVPDVRPYLAAATASVAPLRIARGIQNKVLEAMAMGRPTVVSAAALEGIDAVPGEHVVVANDPDAFAAAALSFAADRSLAARFGQAARARMEASYAWAQQLSAFDALLAAP